MKGQQGKAPASAAPQKRRFRPGDILLVIAGVDRSELARWDTDRSYYIGMGVALLLAATVSASALGEATSIAFHTKITSPAIVAVSIVYFALLLGVDRWLVSDQTAGFAPNEAERGWAGVAWSRHFIAEFFKIAPRIAVALLSSWLFATFLLLAIFNPEIQKQLTLLQQQETAQHAVAVDAQAQDIIARAQSIINTANTQEQQVQNTFNNDQKLASRTSQQEQAALRRAHQEGLHCQQDPVYAWMTNPTTGQSFYGITGYQTVCPRQINQIYQSYSQLLRKYGGSQAAVDRQKAKIARQFHVATERHVIATANQNAKNALQGYQPQKIDGLLARMKALGLLTTKPAGICPVKPTLAQLANDAACTSEYSPDASSLSKVLRFWLIAFEILPVVIKFVYALLPRRGYASVMAARDEEAKAAARVRTAAALMHERTDLARIARREHVRLEEEGALLEYQLRELARQERRLGLSSVRRIFSALQPANGQPTGGVGDEVLEGTVIPKSQHLHPDNPHVDPGNRIIDSEDFL